MRKHLCAALAILAAVARLATGAESSAGEGFAPQAQDTIVPAGAQIELLWNEGEFTEGPAPAADGAILFSDIGNRIYRYDPASGETTVFRDASGKSNGLMFDPRGRLVACEGAAPGGNRRISITDAAGIVRTLADRFHGRRFNSPNDLAIDAAGRVYFTDPRYVGTEPRELDFEAVFLVEPDGAVRVATRDVEKPNGILVARRRHSLRVGQQQPAAGQPSARGVRGAPRRHAGRQARAARFRAQSPRHRRHDARHRREHLCNRGQR